MDCTSVLFMSIYYTRNVHLSSCFLIIYCFCACFLFSSLIFSCCPFLVVFSPLSRTKQKKTASIEYRRSYFVFMSHRHSSLNESATPAPSHFISLVLYVSQMRLTIDTHHEHAGCLCKETGSPYAACASQLYPILPLHHGDIQAGESSHL